MDNLRALPLYPLASISQQIFLNDQSYIIEGDENIFPLLHLKEKPVIEWMPFLESVFDVVLQLKLDSPEIRFRCIAPGLACLPGYYDFAFIRAEMGGYPLIVWSIYDFTNCYLENGKRQQDQNEKWLRYENIIRY